MRWLTNYEEDEVKLEFTLSLAVRTHAVERDLLLS